MMLHIKALGPMVSDKILKGFISKKMNFKPGSIEGNNGPFKGFLCFS